MTQPYGPNPPKAKPFPLAFRMLQVGYLLHSGDPKILWLRTTRLARPPRKGGPPCALEASRGLTRAVLVFPRYVASCGA